PDETPGRERVVRPQPLDARGEQRPAHAGAVVDVKPRCVLDQLEHEMVGRVDRRIKIEAAPSAGADVLEVHLLPEVPVDADLLDSPRRADALKELNLMAWKRLFAGPDPVALILNDEEARPQRVGIDAGPDRVIDQRAVRALILRI